MAVKLHLHFAWADMPHLRLKAGEELGHLYSDVNNIVELHRAARQVGMRGEWCQTYEKTGLMHYDLWRGPLEKAKALFPIADDETFIADMARLKYSYQKM